MDLYIGFASGGGEVKILIRTFLVTVCPSSLGPFYIISYYIKLVYNEKNNLSYGEVVILDAYIGFASGGGERLKF